MDKVLTTATGIFLFFIHDKLWIYFLIRSCITDMEIDRGLVRKHPDLGDTGHEVVRPDPICALLGCFILYTTMD
jgi:hypothetical protein